MPSPVAGWRRAGAKDPRRGLFVGFWWGPSSDCCRKDSGVQDLGLRILALKRLQTAVIESFARAAEGCWGFFRGFRRVFRFCCVGIHCPVKIRVSGLCGDSSSRVYL